MLGLEGSYFIAVNVLQEEDGYYYCPVYLTVEELLKEHPNAKYVEYKYFTPTEN